MPLYEYYCESCDGVFERLRPVRDAVRAEPCPSCNADARRVISTQWSAFTMRSGYPRQLPDTGGYWHRGQRVSKPITGVWDGSHPDLDPPRPTPEPTVEDVERSEALRDEERRAE